MENHFTATEETEARALLQHVLAVINSTDCDHEDFLDSGADSIDLLWQIEPRLKALLGVPQRPTVEAAEAMALHVCEVAGCDRIPEAGAVCNACAPGVTGADLSIANDGDYLILSAHTEAGRAYIGDDGPLSKDDDDGIADFIAEARGAGLRVDDLRTASPPAAETVAGMEEALGGPKATPARVASIEDRIAYAASEHDEYPVERPRGMGSADNVRPVDVTEEFDPVAFELRSGRPLSEETKRKLRDRAGVGPEALARVRRDAQNIARRMADESTNSSAGAAGDLDAIDARVDLLLRNVDNLADAVDRLGAILEAR